MPDSSEIANAIVLKIWNDPTLLALMPNGAYTDLAPDGSTQFVVVSLVFGRDIPIFNGRGFEDCTFAIKAVESSRVPTKNIQAAARRIDELFDAPSPTQPRPTIAIPGYSLKVSRRVEPIRYTERDDIDNSIVWFHRGGQYQIVAAPLAA